MLSLLDVMFDTTMRDIVDQLPLSDAIRDALLGHDNPMTEVLRLAIEAEHADPTFEPEPHVASAYYQAVIWTTQLLNTAVGA